MTFLPLASPKRQGRTVGAMRSVATRRAPGKPHTARCAAVDAGGHTTTTGVSGARRWTPFAPSGPFGEPPSPAVRADQLGGNWGYPAWEGIGNLGKDGEIYF